MLQVALGQGTTTARDGLSDLAARPVFNPVAHRRVWSIQVLRIAGAYGVVLAHFVATQDGGRTLMKGVDIFFVISGFLVWVITSRLQPTPWAFMFNRITRLAPLYWFVTLVGVVLKLAWPGTYYQFLLEPKHILLSILFVPHLDPSNHMYPFIGQGWTLNLDVFYYLLFALCLMAPRRWRLGAVTASFSACVVFGVAARVHHHGVLTQNFSHPLILAFAAGVWIAEAWLRGWLRSRWIGAMAAAAGALLFVACTAFDTPYAGWSMTPWIVASCLGLAGLLAMEGAGVQFASPWLERLSDWSYAIYLFHQIVMMLAIRLLPHTPVAALALLLAGSTLSGWLGYALCERPCNTLFRRLEKAHATLALRLRRRLTPAEGSLTELAP